MASLIAIEVIYADPRQQFSVMVQVPTASTIALVIQRSGVLTCCPNIDLAKNCVGIYGSQRALTDSVQAGDRVEIYRPLLADPREIRRQRALQQNSQADP